MEDQCPSSSRVQVLGSAALVACIARFMEDNRGANNFARVCTTWASAVRCTASRFCVQPYTQASAEGAAAAIKRAFASYPGGEGRSTPFTLELIGSDDSSSALAAHFFQALSDGARAAVVSLTCAYMRGEYPAGQPPPHQLLPNLKSLTYDSCKDWSSLHIADLPHLTHLQVSMCRLEILTLGANLIQLRELDCSYNNLTELDLSSVPQLSHLDVSGNHLTHLDLSSVPQLSNLQASSNWLTALDLSNLPQLSYLDARENQLTALDLSRVPQLSFLDVGDNQLTTLGLSNIALVSNLDVCCNQLTELDLSSVPRLQSLCCVRNKLSELSLEGLQMLKRIECDYNRKLTSLTLASPHLQCVECRGCALTQLTIRNSRELRLVVYSCQEEFKIILPTPAPAGLQVQQELMSDDADEDGTDSD